MTLAQQIADLEARAAAGDALLLRHHRDVLPPVEALARAFGFVPRENPHLTADARALADLIAERDGWKADAERLEGEARSTRDAVLETWAMLVQAGRIDTRAGGPTAELALEVRDAVSGLLEDVPEPAEIDSKMATTPAKSAAPTQAVERGDQAEDSPTAEANPASPPSGLWVITRRDKGGRRFLNRHEKWDSLENVAHYMHRAIAEEVKPRGSKVVALADVPALLAEDAAPKPAAPPSLLAHVAEFAPVGEHPVVAVYADDVGVGRYVVCHASGNGKRHWLCVGGGLTANGRALLGEQLDDAQQNINTFATLIGARHGALELAKAMPNAGGAAEVHDLGTVLVEEERRDAGSITIDGDEYADEAHANAAAEPATPFDGDTP